MRTVKRNPFLSGVCAILGGTFLCVGTAGADVTTDQAAGLIIFPKLIVDNADRCSETTALTCENDTDCPGSETCSGDPPGIDTLIQLSNTSGEPINVRCFYVNANSHCSNRITATCNTSEDCARFGRGGVCLEGWQEIDFRFKLTAYQPIAWKVSEGMPFFPLDGFAKVGVGGEFNEDSSIPGVPEDPFLGELKCFQVGADETPVDRNDLKGEVTIVTSSDEILDARAYNAIGVQAVEGAVDNDNTLVLGRDQEYNACPSYLIMDHFFDDAPEPIAHAFVRSHLTLVPCSQNFALQTTFNTTVQFLVYNEFEQRFSTSTSVRCLREIPLSDIDTRPRSLTDNDPASTGDHRSIFNVNVQGTLTGQTRIRGVDDGSEEHGNGLLGVVEEFHRSDPDDLSTVDASAAFNLHQSGSRDTPDAITVP